MVVSCFGARDAWAQAPTIPQQHEPPGSMASSLGAAPGAGAVPFGNAPGAGGEVLQIRPGPGAGRVPSTITEPGAAVGQPAQPRLAPLATLPPNTLPVYGQLSPAMIAEDEGAPGGITLDQAIERLMRQNLDLISRSYEIPQAQADVLTASLRANPLLYADSQLVPYGSFSRARPGGPTQYDLNISYPIDWSHKRAARTEVACRAKKVLEAQFQNAVRQQIDNLYTAYVNVVAARLMLKYAQASVRYHDDMLRIARELLKRSMRYASDLDRIQVQADSARLLLADAEGNLRNARRVLAVLLSIPTSQLDAIELRGAVKDRAPPPPDLAALIQMALAQRPDVVSYRLGLARAQADVKLARANRFQDVYMLAQPFTFQNNAPFGAKSAVSWAMGVTVPLPVYNRNQGNIERARLNLAQTQVEQAALERQVVSEVEAAAQEYTLSLSYANRYERELIPVSARMVSRTEQLWRGGEVTIVEYLNALREHNDLLRQYLDTLVRHRRSMLHLNTAVGQRILP
jgi:cobalt-zinc-cadmium efflux system outer membrane protein